MAKLYYVEVNGRNVSGNVVKDSATRAARDFKSNHPSDSVKVKKSNVDAPKYNSSRGNSGFGW